MRAALAALALLALAALACGEPDPTTCSDDAHFDCKNVCARATAFCKENCGGYNPSQCSDAGCVPSCEAYRKAPSSIPQEARLLVLGTFNCLDDNESCENFTSCVLTCRRPD